ncbi:MAG: SMI1/KNR4 family protein [Pseudobacteriovorax sp.]|nr:SMI1/KNR4 family protein [Pseudobacteriovorax sp.]
MQLIDTNLHGPFTRTGGRNVRSKILKMMKIHKPGEKIENAELDDLEKKYDFNLPNDYREFMITYNGGRLKPQEFIATYKDGSERPSIVDSFLKVIPKGPCRIESTIINLQILEKRISRDLIPVAETPFGDLICLGVKGKAKEKVYFWNLEENDENSTIEDLGLIANSFQEFIDSLYDPE